MITSPVLHAMMARGELCILQPDGTHLGDLPPHSAPKIILRISDSALLRPVLRRNPSIAFGEAYMDGRITLEKGDLGDLVTLFASALATTRMQHHRLVRLSLPLRRYLQQYNPARLARRRIAHHYDLSAELYEMFLDADRNYSCAYFKTPHDSLEVAQRNKQRLIANKLLLRPGLRVLDIGSGWGGLALALARSVEGLHVTGLTLSQEQLHVAKARAQAEGLAQRVAFHLRDYRAEQGQYDRIVSVGMFEHVGTCHYRTFFRKVNDLLAPDGVALIHAIGRMDGPGITNPWLRKYIFPGGYTPALSEVLPEIEKVRLWVTDLEILRLHYAETLRHWHGRFLQNRERIKTLYDERFCRMWELYLSAAEINFRHLGMMVFQVQLAKSISTVPLTRSYLQNDAA
jgi:cyclopropane-fatty-acyl-phospholipid synthase